MSVHFSKKSDEWVTPQAFFDKINNIFKFELDAASTEDNNKCSKRLNDGLSEAWNKSTWCNPPYSNVKEWVRKAEAESWITRNPIVMLIPARTDTKIWQHHILGCFNIKILFIRGRLKFSGAINTAPFPSALIIWNWTDAQINELKKLELGVLI